MTRYFELLVARRNAKDLHRQRVRELETAKTRIDKQRDEYSQRLIDGDLSSDDVEANRAHELGRNSQLSIARSAERDAAFAVSKVESDYLLERLNARDLPHPSDTNAWETLKGERALSQQGRHEARELLKTNRIGGLQPWHMGLAIVMFSIAIITAFLGLFAGE